MANPKSENPALTQHETSQLKLQPAKDAVLDYLEGNASLNARVREVALELDRMSVVVYLAHGPLDKSAHEAFAKITTLTSTPIIIVPVLFSAGEIEAAEDAIFKSQGGVATVRNDGDTLVVGIKSGELEGRPKVIRSGSLEIPIRYQKSDMEELATRQNDSNPWTAGARVKVGNTGCSSGFGIFNGESGYFMLTAGHCYGKGVTVLDGAGNTMGVTSARNLSIDSILIDVPIDSGYMYDGTWNTTSGAREKVVGTAPVGSQRGSLHIRFIHGHSMRPRCDKHQGQVGGQQYHRDRNLGVTEQLPSHSGRQRRQRRTSTRQHRHFKRDPRGGSDICW